MGDMPLRFSDSHQIIYIQYTIKLTTTLDYYQLFIEFRF